MASHHVIFGDQIQTPQKIIFLGLAIFVASKQQSLRPAMPSSVWFIFFENLDVDRILL
jgi:hypothetical protein